MLPPLSAAMAAAKEAGAAARCPCLASVPALQLDEAGGGSTCRRLCKMWFIHAIAANPRDP